jgi:hypothetical protein
MKDLSISETKKSKKDGNPQKAAKKPQQQKKKVGQNFKCLLRTRGNTNYAPD